MRPSHQLRQDGFQSLFYWMFLIKAANFGLDIDAIDVSILVLLDVPHKGFGVRIQD